MDFSSLKLVRPLKISENNFLEILISQFSLSRQGHGCELKASFDNNTLAISQRDAKEEVQRAIPDFNHKAIEYQRQLDDYLLGARRKKYLFDDPDFVFRFTSGGTLPIIRMNKKEYYCLFYREIFPVGWNIANGGTDTKNELLNPLDTIERELREELIIIDLDNRRRYSFKGDLGKPMDHPQFAVARRFWKERFHWLNLPKFQEFPLNLKWLEGPDRLTVQMAKDDPVVTDGCFLNINALDFGIEIDKVVKINLDQEEAGLESYIIFLDGEIIENQLVNAPVGLFEVSKLNAAMRKGKTEFIPDIFFWNAEKYDGSKFLEVLNDSFIPYISKIIHKHEIKNWERCENKLDFCPITRRIIQRSISLQASQPGMPPGPCEVFLSFGSEDVEKAQKVFDYLNKKQIKTFFSQETIFNIDFHTAIDNALDSARCFIAVGTALENLKKPYVDYECKTFHNKILRIEKAGHPDPPFFIPFISGINPDYLPHPLDIYQSIIWDQNDIVPSLERLARRVLQ